MSTFSDPATPATTRRTAIFCGPLLDLLRTTLAQHGEVTFRLLPADEVDESHNPRVSPHERLVELPDDHEDDRYLTSLVYGLYTLDLADNDPRLADEVQLFTQRAVAVTMRRIGVEAR